MVQCLGRAESFAGKDELNVRGRDSGRRGGRKGERERGDERRGGGREGERRGEEREGKGRLRRSDKRRSISR